MGIIHGLGGMVLAWAIFEFLTRESIIKVSKKNKKLYTYIITFLGLIIGLLL